MRGDGKIYQHPKSRFLWMQYFAKGKLYRESTEETDPKKATKKLGDKIAEIRLDKAGKADFIPNSRLRVCDLLDALEADYKLREVKSLAAIQSHMKPLKDVFGSIRAQELTPEMVDRYIEERLVPKEVAGVLQPATARATVNRETQILGQSFRLAIERRKLRPGSAPQIRRLSEKGNERRGFFEKALFEQVTEHLPAYLRGFVQFGFLSGWRKAEIASLAWQDVDLLGRVIRLRGENAKNGTGRVLALEGDLWQIIQRQRQMREYQKQDKTIGVSLYVFHRVDVNRRTGRTESLPVGDIRKAWATACVAAGAGKLVCRTCNGDVDSKRKCATCSKTWKQEELRYVGSIFHDFRRTAARNMIRSGVPERVAMAITGHKTRAIFDRYNIVSEEDLRQAMAKTQEHLRAVPAPDKQKVVNLFSAGNGGVQ